MERQRKLAGLDRSSEEFSDDPATVEDLLRELLKELRQIRGILGRLAALTTTAAQDDERD